MKHLKIKEKQGFYAVDGQSWEPIDKINKADLLLLLDKAVQEDFEMDPYQAELLGNPAHKIIYENIYEKFNELANNKNVFQDEVEGLYKEALQKYNDK